MRLHAHTHHSNYESDLARHIPIKRSNSLSVLKYIHPNDLVTSVVYASDTKLRSLIVNNALAVGYIM